MVEAWHKQGLIEPISMDRCRQSRGRGGKGGRSKGGGEASGGGGASVQREEKRLLQFSPEDDLPLLPQSFPLGQLVAEAHADAHR